MTDPSDRVQTNTRLPPETKQAMKDADGPMWKLIDEGVRIALGLDEGSTEAAVKKRLEDVQQERGEIKSQIEDLNSRLSELEDMEEDLQKRLEDIQERKQSHKERLSEILEEMESDARDRPVMAWMPDVRDAAMKEYGSESKDNIRRVIEDLRGAALEENYAITSARLSRSTTGGLASSATDGNGEDDLRVARGGDTDDE